MAGRTAGRAEERVVDRSTAAGEGRALEKAVRVELADELREICSRAHLLAVALEQPAWIVRDRMLAVEQRDDLDQIDRQHDDLGDVASRIAQRDVPLAFLLDRKCLDRAAAAGASLTASES